jgi:ABC-type branched-subunit amino acid transport system permease subunit
LVTSAVLVVLALGAVLVGASSVSAAPAHVDHQAWMRTGAVFTADAQDDRLYVSATAGQEQARAFIDVSMTALTAVEFDRASLVIGEAEDGVLPDRARLVACALLTPLQADGELQGRPPEVDCDTSAEPSRADDGTWEIPLRTFTASLVLGKSHGVALLPHVSDVSTPAFLLALDPARTQVFVPAVGGAQPKVAPVPDPGGDEGPTGESSDRPGFADSDASGLASIPSGLDAGQAPAAEAPLEPELAAEAPAPAVAGGLAAPEPAVARLVNGTAPAAATTARSLLLVASVVALAALVILARSRVVVPAMGLPGGRAMPSVTFAMPARAPRRLAPWLIVPALVMLLPETAAYKIGIIAIVFVGAIGLHVLVNVAGELSLAHAAFIGLPAFAVAHASARADMSPVLAVPVGIAAGIAIGLVVAMTALRARGLQVALVTLAVAIATVQFLFYREWVIGPPEGLAVPVPSLFGVELESNIARVPVLAALVALAALAGTAIIKSKLGRGLSLLRTNPDVAAAAGIPVSAYRAMAYAIAGGFAGLAGACYVIWVQLVSPQAFPLQLGFTYLLIAALAGRGGLGGVAVSAVIVQGGALFTFLPQSFTLYVAPVALLLQVTRFEGGINASLRALPLLLANKKWSLQMSGLNAGNGTSERVNVIRLPVALGLLMVIAGFTAIAVAWYNTGRTNQLWIQNQEIVSGGMIGLGLIMFGSTLLLRDALLHGGAAARGQAPAAFTDLDSHLVPIQAEVEQQAPVALRRLTVRDTGELVEGDEEPVEAATAPRKRR